ncbi:MAG TPA: hypothetical protein PKX54_04450 [Candidatus Dojkabacteria bacterium]|jgi:hypothetical protein|nr:hypothetical protein [Candidatus Dojkabacteria bacterium]
MNDTAYQSKLDPTEALLRIVHGDTKDLHIPHKSIVTGKKIRNSILRKFVEKYRSLNKLTDKQLIDVIMSFDEVVEKELLTDDLLEKIRKDPSILQKFNSKKK